jgi:hypothetical protein
MGVPIRQSTDSWLDALTKLIPGEVMAAFTGATQVAGVGKSFVAQLVVLLLLTPLAPAVLYASARRADVRGEVHPLQYVVRTFAFVLYALASSPELMARLGDLGFIPGVGSFVVALIASFVLAPPG